MLKPILKKDAVAGRAGFRDSLVRWFLAEGKDYPWRRRRDGFAVLVSEVMLQQTRIGTVLGFYERFLEKFPDAESLAVAGDDELLKAWEGLGYYRRARMLRAAARAVVADYGGIFPREMAELLALPGVGRYTAGALRAFAFDEPAVVVDGNVARVISRLMDFRESVEDAAGLRKIWQWAGELSDEARPRMYHSALMELGQRICRPGVPDCLACPVVGFCQAREPENLPVKRARAAVTAVAEHGLWLRDGAGRVLMCRESGSRREGLWRLPLRSAEEVSELSVKTSHEYTITRYRVTLDVHDGGIASPGMVLTAGEVWWEIMELARLPMPSPFRVVVERMIAEIEM